MGGVCKFLGVGGGGRDRFRQRARDWRRGREKTHRMRTNAEKEIHALEKALWLQLFGSTR